MSSEKIWDGVTLGVVAFFCLVMAAALTINSEAELATVVAAVLGAGLSGLIAVWYYLESLRRSENEAKSELIFVMALISNYQFQFALAINAASSDRDDDFELNMSSLKRALLDIANFEVEKIDQRLSKIGTCFPEAIHHIVIFQKSARSVSSFIGQLLAIHDEKPASLERYQLLNDIVRDKFSAYEPALFGVSEKLESEFPASSVELYRDLSHVQNKIDSLKMAVQNIGG